jgi:Calcineurin-like phosphoesterase
MPAKPSNPSPKPGSKKILRFAHPFFNPKTDPTKPNTPVKGKRMTDYVQTKLLSIPNPQRDPTMNLDEIIGTDGVKAIEAAGSISIQAVGDTGHENGLNQELVAEAMTLEYDTMHPEKSPAFFLHLGDVIYFDNTDKGYQAQFYVPYKKYPGKIIAIPGNHDGEIFKYDGTSTGQKKTLDAFQRNFCQPKAGVPPDAGTIYREMVSQPGVYWRLNAPLIDIIGLYSNIGEGPGFISGKTIGKKEKDWLIATFNTINKSRITSTRKALVIAVHHPPFSNGGHSSSSQMLADIDDACKQAGIQPDAILAAHSHNYQRFTRNINFKNESWQVPYYVIGTGGRGTVPLETATGQVVGDHSYDSSLMGYGYLTLTATAKILRFAFNQVADSGARTPYDKVITVDLKSHKIS